MCRTFAVVTLMTENAHCTASEGGAPPPWHAWLSCAGAKQPVPFKSSIPHLDPIDEEVVTRCLIGASKH
jgi:hypothetical protein